MGVFMNCTVEMGLGAMIYVYTKIHEDWFRHSKVNRRGGYTYRKVISYDYFYFFKIRKAG
jgi:hypothetical protein